MTNYGRGGGSGRQQAWGKSCFCGEGNPEGGNQWGGEVVRHRHHLLRLTSMCLHCIHTGVHTGTCTHTCTHTHRYSFILFPMSKLHLDEMKRHLQYDMQGALA